MTLPGAVEYVEKADTQTLVLPSTQTEKTQHVLLHVVRQSRTHSQNGMAYLWLWIRWIQQY
jgi:hypothetical protein